MLLQFVVPAVHVYITVFDSQGTSPATVTVLTVQRGHSSIELLGITMGPQHMTS